MGSANQPVQSAHFKSADRPTGLSRRAPIYAVAAVLLLLVIAYVDGGEEPLRPIVQQIEAPGQK